MDRRKFLKLGGISLAAAAVIPQTLYGNDAVKTIKSGDIIYLGPKRRDHWLYLGNGQLRTPIRYKEIQTDVVVAGGGIAGVCAAVSAARHGAEVVLIQDRPMLGGNASSEMHVPVNGAYHLKNKLKTDRETGVVEELQLDNAAFNPHGAWEIWDHILFSYVAEHPNIQIFLNMQAISTEIKGDKISSVICWQSTTETTYKVSAPIFIDSSGDGMMAASAGAEYRTGREGRDEFNESYAPAKADGWCMGDSIQFVSTDMGKPVKYTPPPFAIPYDFTQAKKRKIHFLDCGFWWIELGSQEDIIADREKNRDKLAAYTFGVWDYVKNSGKYPQAENLALTWVGSIAGRRESRRFMGDYILNQNDLLNYRHFDDAVAFGGWSLDEHCPGGMMNPNDPPSFFHARFKKHYEIPYRSLYSRNISNLYFAGRNVSQTHIALSSTRVIATCATMGQAVGTAAALCIKHKESPRQVGKRRMDTLQEMLLRDDAYIPNRPAQDKKDLARKASVSASDTASGSADLLIDGLSRDEVDKVHHWSSRAPQPIVTLTWNKAVKISQVEIKCNSNLQQIIALHPSKRKMAMQPFGLPKELLKKCRIEAHIDDQWKTLEEIDDNRRRCIKTAFDSVKTKQIRIVFEETYGAEEKKLFEVRCYE